MGAFSIGFAYARSCGIICSWSLGRLHFCSWDLVCMQCSVPEGEKHSSKQSLQNANVRGILTPRLPVWRSQNHVSACDSATARNITSLHTQLSTAFSRGEAPCE